MMLGLLIPLFILGNLWPALASPELYNRACDSYCGFENQLCCTSGQGCFTDARSIVYCTATVTQSPSSCNSYCGFANQFCCSAGQTCFTSNQIASCSATTTGNASLSTSAVSAKNASITSPSKSSLTTTSRSPSVGNATSSVIQPVTGLANTPRTNDHLIVGGLTLLAAMIVASIL